MAEEVLPQPLGPGAFEGFEELDELSAAWRREDPPPPYSQIQAPTLAFWQRPLTPDEVYERRCGRLPDDPASLRWMAELWQIHEALDYWRVHDLELFRGQMRNEIIIEIPGASYASYNSHPSLLEREIRSFLSSR